MYRLIYDHICHLQKKIKIIYLFFKHQDVTNKTFRNTTLHRIEYNIKSNILNYNNSTLSEGTDGALYSICILAFFQLWHTNEKINPLLWPHHKITALTCKHVCVLPT